MKQKVDKNVNMTEQELEQLYKELKEQGYSDDQILELSSLRVNDSGLTYGPECMSPNLILVTSDQGDDGYVYREDFYYGTDFSTPEEALAWQEEFYSKYPNGYSINVYECDGKTMIGTFTFQRGREVK
ncbi:MAG: hypothetical protein HFG80_01200 [Eubacterium sp.]|jgi:hypothetical protein|nr:hypothetical protein [Eubacterium sp.]